MCFKPKLLHDSQRGDFAHPKLPLLEKNVLGDVILVRDGSYYSNVPRSCDYMSTRHTWGYEGEGPAGLSFDILFHFTKNYELACKFARPFNKEILKGLDGDLNHVIDRARIEHFINGASMEVKEPLTERKSDVLEQSS